MTAECLEECDDLILWFSEGQYVYKAMELKMQYKPLTPSQQEKYDKRFSKGSAETEEMPDIAAYAGQAEEAEPEDADMDQETASDEKTDQEAEPESSGTEEESRTPDSTEKSTDVAEDTQDKEISSTDIAAGGRSPEKKSKIGNTMPLDEALRQLLRPKNTDDAESEINEEAEPVLDDLEQAIDEIEAVADADMVKQITEKKKKRAASSAGEMTEIIPDDDDQIDGQMNLEDILNDWEGKPESIEEEAESDVLLELDEGEDLFEPENADLLEADEEAETEDGEMLVEEAPSEPEEIEAFEEEEYLEAEEADDLSEMEGEDIAEGAYEGGDEELSEADSEPELTEEMPEAEEAEPDMITEEGTDIDMTAGERTGETMEEQKTRKTEPILPPDIQRMIDEIEGVIPPQEEIEKTPVKRTLKRKEEPRENMGKVADSLRIDNEDFNDEDYLDDELDETGREKYFAEDAEEYFDEEAEEFADEEEYFDEDAEEFADEEEYFDEDAEEFADEEEYFDEDAEEFADEEEYFDEDAEDFVDEEEPADEEEYFEEDEEDFLDKDGYFDSEDYVEDAIDFHEEFRVNPEHSDMPDDREIPDDDDDNMDILSSTKPLSRKETAKMIATGKTAPLPLDEISDALSMTDTGFIVHGRYDLELQSGIGTRAGLTEEQKKLFSYFVPVRGMSEQLVDVLEQDKNCTNRRGTSRTGNLLIVGNKGNGKTVLAVDVVKAIQKQRNIRQGKVAIVTGDSLNKKKIGDIFDKLYGGALIIEKAGKMNEKTVARLNKAMEKDTGELLIVLEEQRKPIDRLLSSNREFRRKFTSRLEVPIFINDELVTFGQTYAQENGYRVDEMGILALYSKIDSLQREDHAVTVAEVKEIMDEAIQHSQKASAKKLVKRVFGKNTDDSDRILLSEKDFNV